MITRDMLEVAEMIQSLDFRLIGMVMKFMHKWHIMCIIELMSYILYFNKLDLT